jgi:hypothetical protein
MQTVVAPAFTVTLPPGVPDFDVTSGPAPRQARIYRTSVLNWLQGTFIQGKDNRGPARSIAQVL